MADVVGGTWFALMAPAGTPMPIVKKLEAACRQIAATDDFKARMKTLAATPDRQHARTSSRRR